VPTDRSGAASPALIRRTYLSAIQYPCRALSLEQLRTPILAPDPHRGEDFTYGIDERFIKTP
jgi:hypothetical protein